MSPNSFFRHFDSFHPVDFRATSWYSMSHKYNTIVFFIPLVHSHGQISPIFHVGEGLDQISPSSFHMSSV